MPDKQYPDAGCGPIYTGETFQTGPKSYLISIGVQGSEVPPFKGELVETGPFTSREGIGTWVQDELARISALGGKLTVHLNNAAILSAGLEQIVGTQGVVTLSLRSGRFSPGSGTPELTEPHALESNR